MIFSYVQHSIADIYRELSRYNWWV